MPPHPPFTDARELPAATLRAALRAGTGHVAVIARTTEESYAVVEDALDQVRAHAVLRLRAGGDEPLADADLDLAFAGAGGACAYQRQRALERCIEGARAAGLPIFAVLVDADTASAERLEHTRMALECTPLAIAHVRIIAVGTKRLAATLARPATRALASRIATRIDIAPQKTRTVVGPGGTVARRIAAYSRRRHHREPRGRRSFWARLFAR